MNLQVFRQLLLADATLLQNHAQTCTQQPANHRVRQECRHGAFMALTP
jgi:hypothetical protein